MHAQSSINLINSCYLKVLTLSYIFYQGIITMGMIGFYMLKVSFGFSGIISWEELLGENLLSHWIHLFLPFKGMDGYIYANACVVFFRFLPYVGWVTIIMTEKPIIKVRRSCLTTASQTALRFHMITCISMLGKKKKKIELSISISRPVF